LARQARGILVAEMNAGQMLEDVQLAVHGQCPVRFYGRMGGVIPLPDEILAALHDLISAQRDSGAPAERASGG
jgi:2-oxoglutarate ferredoxin oxidoreductase subunit alpha